MRTAIVLFLSLVVIFPQHLRGAIWTVKMDGSGDAPTIQAAVDSCTHSDTVLVMPGTYTGEGNRDINCHGKPIQVMSDQGAALTIIDCGGTQSDPHRGFIFNSGEDSTTVIKGFTITNGYQPTGGAVACSASSPLIEGNILDGNTGDAGGGAIACDNSKTIIRGNTILNNTGSMWVAAQLDKANPGILSMQHDDRYISVGGGGVFCLNDSSLIEGNTLSNNYSTWGSAICCRHSTIDIVGNNITDNNGEYGSGTVNCTEGSYSIISNTVKDNQGFYDGAGLYCSGGQFNITDNDISGNRAFGQSFARGGGLFCGTGEYNIVNNDINGNLGCGIWIIGTGNIKNNRIKSNETFFSGPCLTETPLEPSVPAMNDYGGGISVAGTNGLMISGNVIAGNISTFGGGIYCSGSNLEIADNVIYRNSVYHNSCGHIDGGRGGGIYCQGSSPVISGNTIVLNRASNNNEADFACGAGIFCVAGSSPTITSNIISENTAYNSSLSGGIYVADITSIPVVSCCDVFNNSNSNYGGDLGDQTGLNGNFSMKPLFCDSYHDVFSLHELSPCMPGNHPFLEDCGLIGALGFGCDFVETMIQSYSSQFRDNSVFISWTLSENEEGLEFSIYRSISSEKEFLKIEDPAISISDGEYRFYDEAVEQGLTYRYRITLSDAEDERELFFTEPVEIPSVDYTLLQNFPNPFNPSTTIKYYLPENGHVRLTIFDVSGKRVASVVNETMDKGWHQNIWSGQNDNSEPAASGIYFYKLCAGKRTISKKMILLK